jgi:hypothetical protein
MIIQLHPSASMVERELITNHINSLGYKITEVYTQLGA